MEYNETNERVQLLDEVIVDNRTKGTVIGFDRIGNRSFLEIRVGMAKFFASLNQVKKARTLHVTHE